MWMFVLKGFGSIAAFLCFWMWFYAIGGILMAILGLILKLIIGGVLLFKFIHRYERVLCALDGTLGGVITYVRFTSPHNTPMQNVVAVIFGMILGAGWGVLNYEIISKRVLKVVPPTPPQTQTS